MDALSDLLRVVRFSGGLFLESKFREPWCVRSQVLPGDCGPGADAGGSMVAFHYIFDGAVQVRVGKDAPRTARPGAIILLTRNDPHFLGSDVTLPPIDARPLVKQAGERELAILDYGSGDEVRNHFVCGFLTMKARQHPLLAALPSVLLADMRGRPSADWTESSFRYAAREHASWRSGSKEIVARLAELLFAEALRDHLERLPDDATGLLAALRDPALGRALGALHARPAHPWTTEALATEACLSRSAFAERFSNTAGVPPMTYLTQWRMLTAGQRLRESSDTIAEIASAVGYESESTFSRAFTREMGVAPGAWRSSGS